MYRIMTNDLLIEKEKMFTQVQITRSDDIGSKCKKKKDASLTSAKLFLLKDRVVTPWNSLPGEVLNSLTVNEFKGKYDRWLGIVDYNNNN